MNFRLTFSGEWFRATAPGVPTFLACCDCGLVHRVQFRVVGSGAGRNVWMRGFRERRLTATQRKKKDYACQRRTG